MFIIGETLFLLLYVRHINGILTTEYINFMSLIPGWAEDTNTEQGFIHIKTKFGTTLKVIEN